MNAIVITGLTKKHGESAAVARLNLSIGQGELFAFLGVNGAGKVAGWLSGVFIPIDLIGITSV